MLCYVMLARRSDNLASKALCPVITARMCNASVDGSVETARSLETGIKWAS